MADDTAGDGAGLRRLGERLRLSYDAYSHRCDLHDELIGDYSVQVHCGTVLPFVVPAYSAESLAAIAALTARATRIDVNSYPHGSFISATETEQAGETNYDAVWVRDSIWGYLGLRADPARSDDATRVLLTQLDYLASQQDRLRRAIAKPELVNRPGHEGEAEAVHVRFDPRATDFADVTVDGEPQPWTHKQNDALGLLLDAACDAVLSGDIAFARLEESGRLDSLVLLVAYLDAVGYHEMEDSGAWEEIPRRNASSIGLVVSGLERALLLAAEQPRFGERLFAVVPESTVHRMIDDGYRSVAASIAAGGESPLYAPDDPRYRAADAALLNLVYPARLSRLAASEKLRIVELVGALVREHGVIRYRGDTYQSANFWFNEIRTDTSAESHLKRQRAFIEGTEAEWFFDSWLGLAQLALYRETANPVRLAEAAKHLGRSLGQITPERDSPAILAADGNPAVPFSLPESYNHVVVDGADFVLPSPVSPLNWAKATLALLIDAYSRVVREGPALQEGQARPPRR